jgi:DNA-binding GntR family transcriptional regulator
MHKGTKEAQAARFLREGIVAGRWSRGQKLKQEDVARTLGLSITPVREAFKLLEAEGYLLGLARRGVVVAPFEVGGAAEVLELRVMLECHLALAALERLDVPALEGLRALQQDFEAAVAHGDANAVRAINYRFHHQLYAAAERPQALHFVNILWARYPFDLINRVSGRIGNAAAEHAAILAALLTGDRSALLLALRKHILSGWQELLSAQAGPRAAGAGALQGSAP